MSYVERRDFGFDEFYQMLRAAQGVPSTAQVTAIQFCEQYCKYVDKGYTDVVHVTINSTGSGTYDAAVLAQNMLREERPDHKLNIHLIDSHTYSYVYGAPVVQAARRLRNGAEVGYVCAELEAAFARQEIVLSAFSLKQMKKSGRISAAAAFAGELLGLRPIISLIDGVTKVEDKVRGDGRARRHDQAGAQADGLSRQGRSLHAGLHRHPQREGAGEALPQGVRPRAGRGVQAGRRRGQQHRPRRHGHRLPGRAPALSRSVLTVPFRPRGPSVTIL